MALEKLSAQDITDLLSVLSTLDLDKEINIIVEECIPSTNDYLLDLIENSIEPIMPKTAVLAETQTAGKGRQGRVWISPPGNILLSSSWSFTCTLDKLYGLSLVVGIAMARVLRANGLPDVKLKWPNDVFWQERKLGGILIETKPSKNGIINAVIGIGLNIQGIDAYADQISQKNVDLESALQHKVYRNKLVAQILVELNNVLTQFAQHGFDYFVEEWKNLETKTGLVH